MARTTAARPYRLLKRPRRLELASSRSASGATQVRQSQGLAAGSARTAEATSSSVGWIALETGGRYVRSVTGDVDLEQIYSQGITAVLEDQELGSKRRQRWEERFQWLVATALFCLMLEPLISPRRRRGERYV